jgi:BASS family bile acid:Na+ symporter
MVRRSLEWAAWRGSALLALSVAVGFAVPPLAAGARALVTPVVAVLMTLVLLRIDFARLVALLRRPLLVAAMLAWMMLVQPVLADGLARLAGLDGPFGAGLVVIAAGCAITAAPAFARLVGLDAEVALVLVILSTLLVPFIAPPLALGLLGLDLAIPAGALMLRLAAVVGLPLVVSLAIRRFVGPQRLARWGAAVDGAAVLSVAVFGVAVMDGVQATLVAAPLWVAGGLGLAFAANFGLNLATVLAFAPLFGRPLGLAAGLVAGNRNSALYLAVLPAATDPGVLLFLALFQVPLFLNLFLLRPVYDRLRGPGPA